MEQGGALALSDPHELEGLLARLTAEQVRVAVARLAHPAIAAACRQAGIGRTQYYRWPPEQRALIERAVVCMEHACAGEAMALLRGALLEAAAVKITGLRSDDERVRQATATELLDRCLGKEPLTPLARAPMPERRLRDLSDEELDALIAAGARA